MCPMAMVYVLGLKLGEFTNLFTQDRNQKHFPLKYQSSTQETALA